MCRVYFLIGTVAELIKIAPVVAELDKRKINYEIISSGQNDLSRISLYKGFIKPPKLTLNNPPKFKTPASLLSWFMTTFFKGIFKLKNHLKDGNSNSTKIMLVHGDTITTLMGAVLGKITGMKVGHIEAGLRSGNLLDPFPEEIDRVLTSHLTDYHFCPGDWAAKNLKNRKGKIVNTYFNTNIESLAIGLRGTETDTTLPMGDENDFFIFIMHRQENLINAELVKRILNIVISESKKRKCLFIIHEPTNQKLKELGLFELIFSNPNIITSERLSHENFIKVLNRCSFIITDGGGNQEECYYLGIPCLLLRKVSERLEGLGSNVLLSHNEPENILNFIENYQSYSRPATTYERSPSEIIADTLIEFLYTK